MTVTLLSHTPDPVRTVAAAARLCYSKAGIAEASARLSDEKAGEFVRMLGSMGHESPIEHASFTFGIEGVSRAFLAQITRHRIASYSVQSQRYVEKADFEAGCVTPPAIAANPEAEAEYRRCMEQCAASYRKIAGLLTPARREELLAAGVGEQEAARRARRLAIEDARFVLPGGCDTRMIVTMNARSLKNFFRQRCCRRAQWEIRAVAEEMFRLCYAAAPALFETCGPGCLFGPCPEGKMTCKESEAVRGRFRVLRGGCVPRGEAEA